MKYLFALFVLVLITACSPSTITEGDSFIDPGWNGARTNSVIVQVMNAPYNEQKAIEDNVVSTLNEKGLKAIASYNLLLPTRDYTIKLKNDILADSGYETRLEITPYNRDMVTEYIPPAPGPFGTVGYGSGGGFGGVGFGIDFGGGQVRQDPLIHYKTDLYIINDNRKIWTGDYTARGVSGISFEAVGKKFAKEIVKKLEEDGLI